MRTWVCMSMQASIQTCTGKLELWNLEGNGLYWGNIGIFNLMHTYTGLYKQCLDSQTASLCFPLPGNRADLVFNFVWPRSLRNSNEYCYCRPYSRYFSNCATNCGSTFQFSANLRQVCWSNFNDMLLQGSDVLKVYFIYDDINQCSDALCFNSFFSSYWINQQSESNKQKCV